jgi:hypothetical protein
MKNSIRQRFLHPRDPSFIRCLAEATVEPLRRQAGRATWSYYLNEHRHGFRHHAVRVINSTVVDHLQTALSFAEVAPWKLWLSTASIPVILDTPVREDGEIVTVSLFGEGATVRVEWCPCRPPGTDALGAFLDFLTSQEPRGLRSPYRAAAAPMANPTPG